MEEGQQEEVISSSSSPGATAALEAEAAAGTDQDQTHYHHSGDELGQPHQDHQQQHQQEGEAGGFIEDKSEEQLPEVVVVGVKLPTLVCCRYVSRPGRGEGWDREKRSCVCV